MRGHRHRLAGAQGAAHGGGDERLVVGDGEADRDAAALVEVRAAPGQLADFGHDLLHERAAPSTGTPAVGRSASPSMILTSVMVSNG